MEESSVVVFECLLKWEVVVCAIGTDAKYEIRNTKCEIRDIKNELRSVPALAAASRRSLRPISTYKREVATNANPDATLAPMPYSLLPL